MRTMAQTTIVGGIGLLILMLAATVLSVTFATRGAMATNRPIVEVLHFIGAKSGFIASQFQRHFLMLGLEGGIIGGGLAMLLFGLASIVASMSVGTAGGDQLAALFGSFALGIGGYLAIVGADRADRGGDGDRLATDRQPHAGNRRVAPCHPGAEFCVIISAGNRN